MRLAVVALSVLLLPTLAATPLIDESPLAWTFEPMGVAIRTIATDATIAVFDEKVGLAWVQADIGNGGTYTTEFLVRDESRTHRASNTFGERTAVVFDGLGRFHAAWAFRSWASGGLDEARVTSFDGESWQTRILDTANTVGGPLAFELDGVAYVAFNVNDETLSVAGKERIYRLNPATDEWEVLTTHPSLTLYSRAAIDSQGRIHLLFLPGGSNTPRYGLYENGGWTTTYAPFSGGFTTSYDIAVGPDDKPYFTYTDYPARRPHFVRPTANGGFEDILVSTTANGMFPRLQIDTQGTPHIISQQWFNQYTPTSDNYYYHTLTNGTWSSQIVLPGTWQFFGDLALDDSGLPVLALPTTATQTVRQVDPVSYSWGGVVVARPVARVLAEAGIETPGLP